MACGQTLANLFWSSYRFTRLCISPLTTSVLGHRPFPASSIFSRHMESQETGHFDVQSRSRSSVLETDRHGDCVSVPRNNWHDVGITVTGQSICPMRRSCRKPINDKRRSGMVFGSPRSWRIELRSNSFRNELIETTQSGCAPNSSQRDRRLHTHQIL